MSQVIYLPKERSETLGSDFGGLLGAAIGSTLQERARKQQQEEAMQFMEALRKAPDRASGMEVISNYHPKFRTPQDFAQSFKMLDEFHPISMETPTPLPVWDSTTGEKSTMFIPKGKFGDPKFPDFLKSQGKTLTEVQRDDFYSPEGQHIGKLPITQRPLGAVTLPELSLAKSGRAEENTAERLRLSQEAGDRSAQALTASQERQGRVMEGIAARMGETEGVHAQATMKSVRGNIAMVMGAKPLGDTFDFAGMENEENKRKQFVEMGDWVAARIDANPKLLKDPAAVEKLTSQAFKAIAPKTVGEKKAPPVVPTEKGWAAKKWDSIMGESKPPVETLSPAERTSSLAAAKDTAAKIRDSDLSQLEKKKRLDIIRSRLRAAGIKEDI